MVHPAALTLSIDPPHFSGWLHKHSRNMLVANVYQKRYVGLTGQRLVYAKRPELLSQEGSVSFLLSDLEYVKFMDGDNRGTDFVVSFRTKDLRLRAPDNQCAQQWIINIENASSAVQGNDTPSTNPGYSPLRHSIEGPKFKQSSQYDLNRTPDTSRAGRDPIPGASPISTPLRRDSTHATVTPASASPMRQPHSLLSKTGSARRESQTGQINLMPQTGGANDSSDDDDAATPPPLPPRFNPSKSLVRGLDLGLDVGDEEKEPERPLSPRSMLANAARFNSMIEASPSKPPSPVFKAEAQEHVQSSSQEDSDFDSEEEERASARKPAAAMTVPEQRPTSTASSEGTLAASSHMSTPVRQGSLRPRLIQPDAQLPTASPKPGLHHAISQASRSNSAHSSSRDGSSFSSRPVSGRPSYPPSAEEVLTLPQAHAAKHSTLPPPGSSKPSLSGTPNTSLNSSVERSGSARTAAPRLLSGAASRAPPQLDERIELPPPKYPSPAAAAPRPPSFRGRPQREIAGQQAANVSQPEGPAINRAELEENWDSDEEEQAQPQPPKPQGQDAKAHFRVRQPQQQQLVQETEQTIDNSWDSWDDDRPSRNSRNSQAAAAARDAVAQQQQRGGEAAFGKAYKGAAVAGGQHQPNQQPVVASEPASGVREDPNWVEENWDSDDE